MRTFTSKRSALLAVIGVLVVSASAIAWLSASGSGSGTGSVVETSDAMTLTSSIAALDNIGDSDTITVYAANPGSSVQHVDDVTIEPVEAAGCPDGSFVVTDITPLDADVPPTDAATAIATATVTFTNVDSAQNACIGTDTVSYTLGASSN